MSRKTTAALIAALGINFALAGGALMLANLNKPLEYDASLELANDCGNSNTVAEVKADAEQGDLIVPLKAAQRGGNTRVTFTGVKTIPTGREVHEGTWDGVGGAVLYNPKVQRVHAIEVVFDTRSLRTDDARLTNTVTVGEKWFDVDEHPTATFKGRQFILVDATTASHTHELSGEFTLNGITKTLTIPVSVQFAGQSVVIEGQFAILRSDFGVSKRESSIAGTVGGAVSQVEDEVSLSVRIAASPDPTAAIEEQAKLLQDMQEQFRIASNRLDRLDQLVACLEQIEEQARRIPPQGAAAATAVPLPDDLPESFTDTVPIINDTVSFGMVLVPGDSATGVSPIYMSTHEVTWKMLRNWMEGFEFKTAAEGAKLIEGGLHPSIVFGTPSAIIQINDERNPAMGMTRRTATAYAKWVSEKTGRNYRLPTMEEWKHALRAGGGVPADVDAYAWHEKNSPVDQFRDAPMTSPVGSKKPNSLGIYDMLGGVAEWVTNTGEKRIVVGGSIFTPPDELNENWQAVEDIDVWAASHPQLPYSQYWYNDFYVTGIRLVCEPASVVANPPKAVD